MRAIVRDIGKDNPTRARNFIQELHDKTLPLEQHPELGRSGRPGVPNYVHEIVAHRHYIVFYRVLDEVSTVEILRVKHAAQQTP